MGNVFPSLSITSPVQSMPSTFFICICKFRHVRVCVCGIRYDSDFNILSILSFLLCSPHWQYQQRQCFILFVFEPCEAFWSLALLLRSVLTCNCDYKLHDSWKMYKTSYWMNIFTHHMLNPEALCHRKMQSAEYFIFRYSYKGEKSVMNHQHVVEENGTAAILYV